MPNSPTIQPLLMGMAARVNQDWRTWLGAMLVCVLLLLAATWQFMAGRARLATSRAALTSALHAAPPVLQEAPRPTYFTAELPDSMDAEALIRDVFTFASRLSIVVSSAQSSAHAEPAATLSRGTMVVKLTGGYADIKQLVAEVLRRHAGLAVQHLHFQRAVVGAPNGAVPLAGASQVEAVDASVTWVQWARPPERSASAP